MIYNKRGKPEFVFGGIMMAPRVALSILSITLLALSAHASSMFEKINDFDGDGRADFAVTRTEGSRKIWYLWQTTAGFRAVHWGINSDNAVAGDYDGDGRTDVAVARIASSSPVTLDYYVLASQTNSLMFKSVSSTAGPQWLQFPQDYDGDGKTDPGIAMGEASRIVFRSSATDVTVNLIHPAGTVALRIGDMDGDVNCEIASRVVSTGAVTIRNPVTNATRTVHFGISSDDYVPADFDGDGRGDLTIFRESTGDWWWIRSSDNVVNVVHWGMDGDIAVPADYDGDNKTDLAVYRRTAPNGIFYVSGSQSGFQAFAWGVPNDLPVVY